MKILVTGGAGFIGSHLLTALVAQGDQVIVVDNLSTGTRSFVPPEAKFIEADILAPDAWKNEVGPVDAVIHLAAQISVPLSETYPVEDLRTNLQGTLTMLETATFLGAREFRMASSAAVYGDVASLPLQESGPLHPISFYGLNKWAAEQYLLHWAATHGMTGIALRLANVYGPRQRTAGEGGVVAMFCEALAAGTTLTVHGDGSQTRDFIAVQDVARAFSHRLGNPGSSAVYNVSTGTTTSVLNLIDVLGAVSGQDVRYLTVEPRIGDIHDSLLSTTLAEQWGFRAQVPLTQGIEETWHYFQKTGHEIR
ncbi:MAG: UDP-glucose 4-epimerase [Sulfobacillus benefaciens]|uniref:UDP-glucose 4-epimerase n=1 Tax=Sulfobacillus benefaciens TaxID=453960 RepID=A0A2T2XIS3_9FIRM|nr:MAG: UDP-glucose 4-epimerase [Sulfobacillus benefaciens]